MEADECLELGLLVQRAVRFAKEVVEQLGNRPGDGELGVHLCKVMESALDLTPEVIRPTKQRTKGAAQAPMRRPWRAQRACGMISPKITVGEGEEARIGVTVRLNRVRKRRESVSARWRAIPATHQSWWWRQQQLRYRRRGPNRGRWL